MREALSIHDQIELVSGLQLHHGRFNKQDALADILFLLQA